MPTHPPLKAVLFDLDGTLCDTVPDLHHALNTVLIKNNKTPVTQSDVLQYATQGVRGLVELGFQKGLTAEQQKMLQNEVLHHYEHNNTIRTRLYHGMEDVLQWLEQHHMPWGIVTNKYTRLTHPTLKELGLDQRTAAVVCGDTLSVCKPDPEPVAYACELMGIDPAHTCFIGDALRDITAGNAAGTRTLTALWGYITKHDQAHQWPSEAHVQLPLDLIDCFEKMMEHTKD